MIDQGCDSAFYSGLRLPSDMKVSEWADKSGRLIDDGMDRGPWRTRATQRAVMDAFGHHRVEQVTVKKSVRWGFTHILGHVQGYYIAHDPRSILMLQPTDTTAKEYSKDDLDPMIACTPALAECVAQRTIRSSKNTLQQKHYQGGIAYVRGANSPNSFRKIKVGVVLGDEIDAWPPTAGKEGEQLKLAAARAETEPDRKIGYGSTPTVRGLSKVGKLWDESSKGYCFLTCPHCGGEHIRKFREPSIDEPMTLRDEQVPVAYLKWDDEDINSAVWVCPHCRESIGHQYHHSMLEGCNWKGEDWSWTAKGGFDFLPTFDGHIGFWVWAGYGLTPKCTPSEIVKGFLDAKAKPEELITYVNTVLAEEWREPGETASTHALMDRREAYKAECPHGVLVLVCGVDVQSDRLELEVIGYGRDNESWSIEYEIIWGNPVQNQVWVDLERHLSNTYQHEGGAMLNISAVCVDSGNWATQVYAFIKKQKKAHWYAVKGVSGQKAIIEPRAERINRMRKRQKKGTAAPELVGNDKSCTFLYQLLNTVTEHGPGFQHFPIERDEEYFLQLTAMTIRRKYFKGRAALDVHQEYARAEAHDCRKYGYAAFLLLDPDLDAAEKMLKTGKKQSLWAGLKR